MENLVSVIIPNRNAGSTIGKCLEAALASRHDNFEVIVVDDASQDNSVDVIAQYPCKLVRLTRHGGAAAARNTGARQGRGSILFFTDADCLLQHDAIALAVATLTAEGPEALVGGTYTAASYDRRFCSRFQSVFISYFETRRAPAADYIATHALAMYADTFFKHQGFASGPWPILEDVEFSHRLHRAAIRLVMNPAIRVRHIFNYSLRRSLRNAFVKSKYWTCYAIANHDLLADSGTASLELKINVSTGALSGILLLGHFFSEVPGLPAIVASLLALNLYVNRGLIWALRRADGFGFAAIATLYYLLLYPVAVGAGALGGLALHFRTAAQFERKS